MRIQVELELCQGHGVCEDEAPEVFRVVENSNHYSQVELILPEPDEGLRSKVEAAVRYCPNRVLSIIDNDAGGEGTA